MVTKYPAGQEECRYRPTPREADTTKMSATDAARTVPVPDHPTLRTAMRLAARAPSVHNTQPWQWRFDGARLTLTVDADRLLPAIDPLGRQLVISCGAMLHHLRTVCADLGWHTDVIRVPDRNRPDRLAVLGFRPWPAPPAWAHTRARAIARRRSERLPLRAPQHWEALLPELRAAAARHRCELHEIAETDRPRLAAASRELAAVRGRDVLYDTEIHWWSGHPDSRDGIPPSALVSSAEFARVGVGRAFPPIPRSPRRTVPADRARLLVLTTATDSVTPWLCAGEALSELLLECTTAGLSTCALTDLAEVPTGRALLSELIAHPGAPQVLIRVGMAAANSVPPPPTPRRPIEEFCTGC